MATDVIILPHQSASNWDKWREYEVRRELGGYQYEVEYWRQLALARVSRALNGDWQPMDVFLCLRGDHWEGRYEPAVTEMLLSAARDYAWGSPRYLAARSAVTNLPLLPAFSAPLADCLEMAHDGGVTDILEIEMEFDRYKADDDTKLRNGAANSYQRHQRFKQLMKQGQWSCLAWSDKDSLHTWLEPHIESRKSLPADHNLFTVIGLYDALLQEQQVKKALRNHPQAGHAVALCNTGASLALKQLCQRGEKEIPQLYCNGPLELRYLLMQQRDRYQARNSLKFGEEHKVDLVKPRFATVSETAEPALLLTSAYDQAEAEICLAAARGIGWVTQQLPPHAAILVNPALRWRDWPGLLGTALIANEKPLAWVFVGQGNNSGLFEAGESNAIEPQQWLDKFANNRPFALAIFCASNSAETAQAFAQAGVSITVGFEGKVSCAEDVCRWLVAEMVQALWSMGNNQNELLQAYHYGCQKLDRHRPKAVHPMAFYAPR